MHSPIYGPEATLLLRLASERETLEFAKQFGLSLGHIKESIRSEGFNLRLTGALGAGKTTFTRALLRALGFQGRVKSPTFELLNEYPIFEGITLRHFDFYRFESPIEFEEAGFRDLFGPGSLCVTEWSDKAEGFLPAADLEITLKIDDLSRDASIAGTTEAARALIETLRKSRL